MTSARRTALLWILLSSSIGILWGTYLEVTSYAGMADFKAVYYGAECLIHHRDPYNPAQFQSVYQAEGGKLPSDPVKLNLFQHGVLVCINLPTSLLLVAPLAMLAWGPAHIVWMLLVGASFMLAAWLIWNTAAGYAPRLALLLVCIALANIEVLFALGNMAGIAVSLCVLGVWCFLNQRFVWAGTVCMALALVMKPQDAALVWLYFLLAGGARRKWALQTLLVACVLILPSLLWVSHVAPHWAQELHANLVAGEAPGNLNDPGPASLASRYSDTVISLQAVISIFRNDPRIYNPASYLLCAVPLLLGAVRTLRSRFSQSHAWFALAAIAPLSMLPVYHRLHDAKLLLLSIPACALLWAGGGPLKWTAALLNTAAMVVTADIPSTLLLMAANTANRHASGFAGALLELVLMRPASLLLLALGIFYLWIYFKRTAEQDSTMPSSPHAETAGLSHNQATAV